MSDMPPCIFSWLSVCMMVWETPCTSALFAGGTCLDHAWFGHGYLDLMLCDKTSDAVRQAMQLGAAAPKEAALAAARKLEVTLRAASSPAATSKLTAVASPLDAPAGRPSKRYQSCTPDILHATNFFGPLGSSTKDFIKIINLLDQPASLHQPCGTSARTPDDVLLGRAAPCNSRS